jgi:uncharacterized protein YndB with AHSA1/START domain
VTTVHVTRSIAAPLDRVFQTVSNIERYAEAIPHIESFKFLSAKRTGIGTRFRETRVVKGKEHVTQLEITEFVPNEHVRLIADSHGTVWDSTFRVSRSSGATQLELTMEARAHKLFPWLLNPLMAPFYRRALNADMNALKAYCEWRR